MRKPIVGGNWKMHKLVGEAVQTVEALKPLVAEVYDVDIVVCPTFTALYSVVQAARGSNVQAGAQNCYKEEKGAFTGEIAPQMIADTGAQWAVIGHSERRHVFGETDQLLNEKVKYVLANTGLNVIFCIGETIDERKSGAMEDVLKRQVGEGLAGLSEEDFSRVVVAYEPVWAIGTGETATPEQAEEAHAFTRGIIESDFGGAVAEKLRIQYGGSVKPNNAAELIAKPNVDGFLVGGASLEADSFAAIIKAASAK